MDKKPKKPSTYDMLKSLDKKVQKTKSQNKDDDRGRPSSDNKRRRSPSPRDSRRRRSPSPRDRRKVPEVIIDDTDYDIPDRTFGDLYCKACDSHMNSDQMWEAHIQGKRHLKNIKRVDIGEQKYDVLHQDPLILADIKKSTEPIIGLQHCCEIRRLEGKPIYQCFLCSANVPNGQALMEHVIGLKHRMAYLKEHDPVKHDLIDKTNLKKGMIEPVVAECVRLHQDKHGTGIMQVKLDKTKPSAPSTQKFKKPTQDDFDSKDRQNLYPDERGMSDRRMPDRDADRYDDRHPQDYERGRFPDDPYDDRYRPFPLDERDRPFPLDDRDRPFPMDDRARPFPMDNRDRRYPSPPPPMDRRSPSSFERGYYGRVSPSPRAAPNHQSYDAQWPSQQTQSSQNNNNVPRRDIQDRQPSSNVNLFQSLLKIIESMPSMMFLEIVLHRVENMNPTEGELAMLQKIGNHLISIVMNQKLQKLSPDLLGKYQGNSKSEMMEEQSQKSANNLSSLMDLVSQFNSTKSSSSVDWGAQNSSPSVSNATFSTQSSGSFYNWGSSSSAATEIPGLTLSSTSEEVAQTQRPQETLHLGQIQRPQETTHLGQVQRQQDTSHLASSWSDTPYNSQYGRF